MNEQTTDTTDPATDPVLPFRLRGRRYVIKPMEVSTALVRECRAETNYSPTQLFSAFNTDRGVDLDVMAGLIWLARRQAGEPGIIRRGRMSRRLISEIEDGLDYDALNTLEMDELTEEPADPQA